MSPLRIGLSALYCCLAVVWIYGFQTRSWLFVCVSAAFLIQSFLFRNQLFDGERRVWPDVGQAPTKLVCLCIVALVGYAAVGWYGGRGFTPVIHDEHAYLFQAKTFAAGKLSYPPPPNPEFFDAFHILTEHTYASKYPPGHAVTLVPGVWLGFPMLMPLFLNVGSLVLLYYFIKSVSSGREALLTVLLFSVSPIQFEMAASYYSHTSELFFLLLFALSLTASVMKAQIGHTLLAGIAMGIAFSIRPLTAAAFCLPFLLYWIFLAARDFQNRKRRLLLGLGLMVVGLVPSASLFLAYNNAVTGSPIKMPWIEYSRRYMPEDKMGFAVKDETTPTALSEQKAVLYRDYVLALRREYTFGGALRNFFLERLPKTLRQTDENLGIVIFLPAALAFGGFCWGNWERVMGSSVFCLLLSYFFYYGYVTRYHFEATPFILYFSLKGIGLLIKRFTPDETGWVRRFLRWHLMAGMLIFILWWVPVFVSDRRARTAYHASFRDLVARLDPGRKVIFIRYKPDHYFHFDLINNDPDLGNAPHIFALDLEELNKKLMVLHPDRQFYLFGEASWTIKKYEGRQLDSDQQAVESKPNQTAKISPLKEATYNSGSTPGWLLGRKRKLFLNLNPKLEQVFYSSASRHKP